MGNKWLPGFSVRIERHDALTRCPSEGPQCLEEWITQYGVTFTHLYVPIPCEDESLADRCGALRAYLEKGAGYRMVYENSSAVVYERLP